MFKLIASLAVLAGAIFVSPAVADPLPSGFFLNNFNGSTEPVTIDGVTIFHIEDGECSNVDYGDGRGESDCLNGNVRSEVVQDPWVKVGRTLEYRFDLQVDRSLQYEGYFNHDAAGFEPDLMGQPHPAGHLARHVPSQFHLHPKSQYRDRNHVQRRAVPGARRSR